MNCIIHKNEEAIAICTKCGAPICNACRCTLDGAVVCPSCLLAASKSRANECKSLKKTFLIYIIFASLVYLAGLLCFIIGNDILYYVIGVLLMGIMNITFAFKAQFLLVSGLGTRVIFVILCIVFGIVTTPVFIIKSAIKYGQANKKEKEWLNLVSECEIKYGIA